MDDVGVRLAAHRLEALRGQLPPSTRGGERELLRALLDKFPAEIAADALEFRKDMNKAEVRKKDYDWDFQELTALLSSLITANQTPSAEANASDVSRRNGDGDRLLFTAGFKGCLHCGFDNHATRECTVPPCGFCGFRFCFGVRKKGGARGCLVKKVVGGGKITDSDVGFNGRPLPPALIDQMNDKAAKLKAAGGEANSTETQTEPEKNVIDPDDLYAGESDCCELYGNVCC